ncbi:MAG: dihydroorotase [Mycoplasma sp.]
MQIKKNKLILLQNGLIYYQEKLVKKDILIINGKIQKIEDIIIPQDNPEIINCEEKLITRTFVDGHVHTRNPGLEYKETLETFINSCLHGGVREVIAMGNVLPFPDSVENFKIVNSALRNNDVIIHQCANITKELKGTELVDFSKLKKFTNFFTDDGKPINYEEIMEQVLCEAKKHGVLLLLHEESMSNQNSAWSYQTPYSLKNNLPFFTEEYETKLVKRDLKLNEKINANIHIQHISTSKTIEIVNKYRKKGMNVTMEVTPHHLLLSASQINEWNPNFKMNPPLGLESWRLKIIESLKKGHIHAIVTDHAPHTNIDKDKEPCNSAYGIIGVQWLFSAIYTELVLKNIISLECLIEHITNKPSKLFFNQERKIKLNEVADLLIINLSDSQIISEETIQSKSKNTPFLQKTFFGIPEIMIINEQIKFIKN